MNSGMDGVKEGEANAPPNRVRSLHVRQEKDKAVLSQALDGVEIDLDVPSEGRT